MDEIFNKEKTGEVKDDGALRTLELLQSLGISKVASQNSMYRREFKISGSIEDGSTKALNYINLCSQINDGKKRGYKSDEIVAAVKRAITPGTGLRTYVDSQQTMSLDSLLQFLRSYFHEQSPTELFTDLTKLCQKNNEDASSFLLHALEVRQKVLIASTAEGMIKYDASLVQSIFLHTIRTGLRHDLVRTHMQPYLDPTMLHGDDILIREINIASAVEAERTNKQKQSGDEKKKIGVAAAEVETRMDDVLKPLVECVTMMKKEIQALRSEVSNMKNTYQPNKQT